MKVFVTGGAGFLGRNVVRRLKGNSVRVFDLADLMEWPDSTAEEVDFVRGDVLDYKSIEESCRGFDAVIHLAARTGVIESMEAPEKTGKVNVEGTVNILRSCAQNKIKKMILASSAAVYGKSGRMPVSEDAPTEPLSPYGRSKLEAERQVAAFSERFGICGVSLRIFNVYGRGQKRQRAGVIPRFVEEIAGGRQVVIYGDGMQTRDFVAVDDVAAAFELALGAAKSATYNIASGRATSINELVQMLAGISGREVTPTYRSGNDGEVKYSAADISLARSELGFEPKTLLEEGLEELASVPDQVCH